MSTMGLRQVDCPKCNGTGKLNTDSHQAGRKSHRLDWTGAQNRGVRGPWGWLIVDCARCHIQRTKGKKSVMYRDPGGEWNAGFTGCNPKGSK